LIGETYLPNTAELDKWYGGPAKNELQLPMDMLLGFSNKLSATTFRTYIQEAETELNGSQPLFVFDNHDNSRSVDRYAPPNATPEQRDAIGKLLATVLLSTRAAALMYQGEELGMVTSTPTRREDVKDPIGITGWPKEKGRDGERTPMQWTAGPQAGFSTDPHTWLPIPPSYIKVNVASESKDPDSQLTWYRRLIQMRRTLPALRDGGTIMLNTANPSVLSFVRTAPAGAAPVLVLLNMTDSSQSLSLDLQPTGLSGHTMRSLLTDAPALSGTLHGTIDLPPYASWIGTLQ
jgi:alpha-glucosidase